MAPRRPQDGPKRALRKLKCAREGPKTEPKWPKCAPRGSPRGLQEGTPTHLGSGTPPGPPWDPSRSPPGPLQGQILEPIGEHFVHFWFDPACPQTSPKLLPAQTRHGHRPIFFPHRPELSKFGERPVTSPQASSIRPLPRQGEERRAETHMSIWSNLGQKKLPWAQICRRPL